MLTDQSLLFLLVLVLAIGAGWGLHAWSLRRREAPPTHGLTEDYFRGLNHLLNEEPDKALEVFIRMVEVDSDTVETHFALGSLFRRRGEVDRAIRIHQNLIARPSLSRTHRLQALHELGEDYMRAGLFDRAESLFSELAESGEYVAPALRQLVAIYEQQRDWEQAIATAQRLELVDGTSKRREIAHYWCELAQGARDTDQRRRALQFVRKAQAADPQGVRPEYTLATLLDAEGEVADALRAYQRVVDLDPAFSGEVLTEIAGCYRKLGDTDAFDTYLAQLRRSQPDTVPFIAMAAFHEPGMRSREVLGFTSQYLQTRGQVLGRLLEKLVDQRSIDAQLELDSARDLVRVLLEDHPRYLCRQCGLSGNALYWQCPSCRAWGTTLPNAELPYTPSASALPEGTVRR